MSHRGPCGLLGYPAWTVHARLMSLMRLMLINVACEARLGGVHHLSSLVLSTMNGSSFFLPVETLWPMVLRRATYRGAQRPPWWLCARPHAPCCLLAMQDRGIALPAFDVITDGSGGGVRAERLWAEMHHGEGPAAVSVHA